MAIAIALPVEAKVGVLEIQLVPLDVKMLPLELGATKVGADVPLPIMTLFAVNVDKLVPPLATGSVPVTLIVKLTNVFDVVPVPPLAIGSVPVTPVVSGRPVKFVAVPLEGVPNGPPVSKILTQTELLAKYIALSVLL